METVEKIVICDQVTKNYKPVQALAGVNFTLPAGKIVGLLGPNGSGKTTLIKILAGLLKEDSGTVLISGRRVSAETKAIVSYLPERPYFPQVLKVGECLDFFADFYEDFDRKRAEEMLETLKVPLNVRMKTLSKGSKEKVQLVLVMSRRAKLYLLDEPIGGVDPATREYILNTIIGNYEPSASVLISTHLISDVENVLDEFMFLQEGQIVMQDTVDHVREEKGQSLDALFREVFKC